VTSKAAYEDARLKMRRGELKGALQETERALNRYKSKTTEWHWRFQVLKAEILDREGLGNESLAIISDELPASLADSDVAVRRKLTQGLANARVHQLADAARFVAEGEALARAKHPELLGEVALKKGTIYFLAGDIPEAESCYREALEIARGLKDPFLEASALSGLGVVATRNERYDEAVEWNRSALDLSQSIGAIYSLAQILGNMAWSYRELGDFERALALYKQAIDASARSGLVEGQTYWLTGISTVYYLQHDYDAAEAVLIQAVDFARKQGDKRILAEYLNELSEIALEKGRVDFAERYNREAIDLGRNAPDQPEAIASLLDQGRIAEGHHNHSEAERLFQRVALDTKADSSQKWEAQARLAKDYAERGLSVNAEKEFVHSLATIETVRSSVQAEDLRLSFLSGAISFYNDYIEFLLSQRRVEEALLVAELSRSRTLAEGLSPDAKASSRKTSGMPPRQLAQRLHTTLLFYWLGEQHSYLWAVTPAKTSYFTLPPSSEINALVKAYTQAIVDSRDVLSTGERLTGEKLYAMLIAPAQKFIPANSRVILLPDGGLYGLNFETLIAPQPQPHYWIEDVTLTTGSSLSLLASSADRPAAKEKNLLLIGNTKEANSEFPPLLQSANEMKKIEQYFPEPHRAVLGAERATPRAYMNSKPERFAYVHFATHGTASRTRPLESAVVLSKEPSGDTYKLYARDIVTRHLQAELVTISACYGSGTRAYSGEGLVGLSWAFLRAGAHNVIGALWEVSDAPATPELMEVLYHELGNGKDPATALRTAKLSLLHSANPGSVFRKPFYWAPFQLYAGS
jgi:CHAT domain-containing protein